MHGLVIWGICHIVKERVHAALVCMVMAVYFKQMSLYFVFPFIVQALVSIKRQSKGSCLQFIARVILLVAVFFAANFIIMLPFIAQ